METQRGDFVSVTRHHSWMTSTRSWSKEDHVDLTFRLSDVFLSEYKNRLPDFGPLGQVTYLRTYSRTKEDGTQEQFWETLRRVVEGVYQVQKRHCLLFHLPWSDAKAQVTAQEMFRRMWEFKLLPPGRSLWAMGSPVIEKLGAMPLYNCGGVTTADIDQDFADPFIWTMDALMLGVGVGFDTKGAGQVTFREPTRRPEPFVVPDSREGWCAAVRMVLNAYVGSGSLPESFDYSLVRPFGTPIKTFGGTASGPGPLMDLIDSLNRLLSSKEGQAITSADIVDIFNMIGRCVVSGNVRRSASLGLGEPDDKVFFTLKDPSLFPAEMESHRWASNNSVLARVGMAYGSFAERTALNGEPGYVWLENMQGYGRMNGDPTGVDFHVVGVNPCGELPLENRELCNLAEVFPVKHDSYEDFQRTLRLALYYVKTVTLIPTHSRKTNNVMLRNRRVGVSLSGIVPAAQKHGRRNLLQWCDKGYNYLRQMDQVVSGWLCIPRSIKLTTVKPSGTISLLPHVAPGIHFPHSEYYIRRIRFGKDSPLVEKLSKAGYPMEEDVCTPNTIVVEFPVKEPHFDRAKSEVSMWEQLEWAAQLQRYWSDNAVSVTVTFKPEEAGQIKYALELYETRLKSVSFLPMQDHGYKQAPYETISREEYERRKVALMPLEEALGEKVHDRTDAYCEGDRCQIV